MCAFAEAVRQIVEQSASEILKMYLLDPDRSQRAWTPEQAWLLVKELSTKESVRHIPLSPFLPSYANHPLTSQQQLRYSEVLLSSIYKSNGESALRALEQAEMISIASVHGRPHSIRAGRPVYASAFRVLTDDRVLRSRLELSTFAELIRSETASVEKVEAELNLLANLLEKSGAHGGGGGGVLERVRWLGDKLRGSQRSIEGFEREVARLKKVLLAEY